MDPRYGQVEGMVYGASIRFGVLQSTTLQIFPREM
jgi:hypothetical protein